jgi:hypothetical protein
MKNESKARSWVRGIAAGFLGVTVAVTFAVAGNHQTRKPPTPVAQHSVSDEVSPLVRAAAAESGIDIGPGSDEAQLVGSPQPR